MKKLVCVMCILLLTASAMCGCQMNSLILKEYDNGWNVVEHNGVVYCADETGLWISEGDSKDYLYNDGAVRNIAASDDIILFSTYDPDKVSNTGDYLDADCAIHVVQADGSDEHELFETIDMATPICIVNHKLYYVDVKDIYSIETLAQTMWLKSYDIDSGEETPLAEDVNEAVSIDDKIVYKNMGFDIADKTMKPHCYSMKDDTITDIGDMPCSELFKLNGSVYFTSFEYEESSSETIASIYRYDPKTGELELLFSDYAAFIRDINGESAIIGTADYVSGEYTCYEVDLSDNSITLFEGLPENRAFDACYCGDGVFFIDNETMNAYYYDGSTVNKVSHDFERGYHYTYHNGVFYYFSYNTDGLKSSPWSFSEDKVVEEEDFSYLLGWWGKDYGQGAGVGVNFISFDGNIATFEINTSSYNSNKLASSDEITAPIIDNEIRFHYEDSWLNSGTGEITINDDSIYITASPNGDTNSGYALFCDDELTKNGWRGFM